MKVTWLTQAGLLFEGEKLTILVDPYLSNSVGERDGAYKNRRIRVDEKYFDVEPDVIIVTHDHLDHYDPESAERILKTHRGITVLCPMSVWEIGRAHV